MQSLRRGLLVLAVLSWGVVSAPSLALVRQVPTKDGLWVEPAAVTPRAEALDPGEGTALGLAAREFLARHGGAWAFRRDPRTGKATLVQGSGIPLIPGRGNRLDREAFAALGLPDGVSSAESLEPLARRFLEDHSALVLPEQGLIVLDPGSSLLRAGGRLASLYFDWLVDGVPVEGAHVFVRVNSGNVTQFGSTLVGPIELDTRPELDAAAAVELLLAYAGDEETAQLRGEPELVVVPVEGPGAVLRHRLIWKLSYRLAGRLETWEGRVDAHTGEIVGFRDTNRYAHAVGGVYPRTVYDANETVVPLPLVDVTTQGGVVTADTAGSFGYGGGEVGSGLDGHWFDTNCQGCTNPAQPGVLANGGIGRLDFGTGGADEVGNGRSTPADRNSYYHLNQIRRLGLKWLPGLGFLANTHFTSNVNIVNTCNAVFTGDAVNFYRSGGGCNNSGEISDVMQHEYGHGIDGATQSGDGATGEATADVVAMHMSHDALVGPGFHTDGSPVRDLNSSTSSHGFLTAGNVGNACPVAGTLGPLGYEVHCEGEIYGQTQWDLSRSLLFKYGNHTGWRESERIFFGSLPDAEGYLPSSSLPVYDAYINADDDDGNLANGTPNATQIFAAFNAHEIANSSVPGSAHCARPPQPVLVVTPQCDHFDLSWSAVAGAAQYVVLRSELHQDTAYFPRATLPSTQTAYTDSEVAPSYGYWYVVLAVNATGCESKVENPVAAQLPDRPILSVAATVADDAPTGNQSGFADPGEQVDLVLTLANLGPLTATSVSATVAALTPGASMLFGNSTWPNLAGGASGANQQVLRFATDAQQVDCGDVLDFQLVPDDASSCAGETSYFQVQLGERLVQAQDAFETDLGWQPDVANSTASTGQWVRGNPDGTQYQPNDDVTPGGGTQCWFTATNPGGAAGTDDVDGGVVVLLSPLFDLTGLDTAEVSYWRWFALSDPGEDANDFFKADVSDNGGASWVNLETLGTNQPAPSWVRRSFRLGDYVQLTNQVRFRFQAQDAPPEGNVLEAAIDDFRIDRFACDDTPACFVAPTFAGLESAVAGSSCGEIALDWGAAASHCPGGVITYNVYRSTVAGFTPGPASLVAAGLTATALLDIGLVPGQGYHYIVRADDSLAGEDPNLVALAALAPVTPDANPPAFTGLQMATSGASCGETVLGWQPAIESCNGPAAYDVYRSTNLSFTPGPATRVATTYATSFVDTSAAPGVPHAYVVRARDMLGNQDTNGIHLVVNPTATDLTLAQTSFEPNNGSWAVSQPNNATAGNWQWGNPQGTPYQPENDATPNGVNCWITGLASSPSNGDVDGGTTTLLSAPYNLAAAVNPVVGYARWFTNDQGGSPGDPTDTFLIDVSNDSGQSWTPLEEVGAGTPLNWVPVQYALPVPPTSSVRFRFTARDLGAGSLVEAGIDDFKLVDVGQGCTTCVFPPPQTLCSIHVGKSGGDVVVNWAQNPMPGYRKVVYHIPGCGQRIKLGSTLAESFVHEHAALSPERFNYQVTFVDPCGAELPFCGTTDCP